VLSGRLGIGGRVGKLPQSQQMLDAEQKSGAAHAAGQNCHLHALRP
jgi:hypothetical protein